MLLTAVTSIAARLVALAIALATIRLGVHYLGASRYGLWMTVTSVTAFLTFSDLGIGNAIINRMSAAFASHEQERARREVSSATAVLSGVAVVVLVVGAGLLPLLAWDRVYNVHGLAAGEAGPATLAVVACFALLLPLGLVQKVQLGFQDGAIANLWLMGGNLLGLLLLLACISNGVGLPWLVLAVAGGPVVATGLNWMQEFVFSRPWLRPRPSGVELQVGLGLARTGFLFLGLQIASAVAFSSDNFIATQVLGPVAVAQYSTAQRLFVVLPALLSVAALSLWPAYSEALVRADRPWIRRTLVRSAAVVIGVTALGSTVILAASPLLFSFLIGGALVPPITLSIGFAVWAVLYALGNVVSMLLNAANVITFQLITAALMAVSAILLKIEFARLFGVAGIVWAAVIAYGLVSMVPTLIYLRRRRRIDW